MNTWDKTFMNIALLIAEHSTCAKLKVGAILTKDKRIISTGYNGSFSGDSHCKDITWPSDMSGHSEWSNIYELHAEVNCLIFASLVGLSPEGSTIYITDSPCINCAKLLIASKIKRVCYLRDYRDSTGLDFIKQYIPVDKIIL